MHEKESYLMHLHFDQTTKTCYGAACLRGFFEIECERNNPTSVLSYRDSMQFSSLLTKTHREKE
jgi:hypothetical protein